MGPFSFPRAWRSFLLFPFVPSAQADQIGVGNWDLDSGRRRVPLTPLTHREANCFCKVDRYIPQPSTSTVKCSREMGEGMERGMRQMRTEKVNRRLEVSVATWQYNLCHLVATKLSKLPPFVHKTDGASTQWGSRHFQEKRVHLSQHRMQSFQTRSATGFDEDPYMELKVQLGHGHGPGCRALGQDPGPDSWGRTHRFPSTKFSVDCWRNLRDFGFYPPLDGQLSKAWSIYLFKGQMMQRPAPNGSTGRRLRWHLWKYEYIYVLHDRR